ncbi:hypothetical protein [Haloechinothrix halophila]|uniref:hypothetical protein n=1 Tax=Haloechinothrix halophila TaxID=1069073 RepID=UPI00041F1438|nr:hypothetical protein [Haloechinothrix halophila]
MAIIVINAVASGVAVLVLIGVTLWVVSRALPRGTGPAPAVDAAELDSTLAHAQATVSWASGTRRDWDRHVRPVLARQLEEALGPRRGDESRHAAGEMLLGPLLWPLVDPHGAFTTRLDGPGPGRDALATILDRLESS